MPTTKLRNEVDIHFVTWQTPRSFDIEIPKPHTIGTDRIANIEAAVRKIGVPSIIVDAGTAITVDVVNNKKQFLGGMISPGVGISLEALYESAARLSPVPMKVPERVIGNTTAHSLHSGIQFGFSSLIDGLIEQVVYH